MNKKDRKMGRPAKNIYYNIAVACILAGLAFAEHVSACGELKPFEKVIYQVYIDLMDELAPSESEKNDLLFYLNVRVSDNISIRAPECVVDALARDGYQVSTYTGLRQRIEEAYNWYRNPTVEVDGFGISVGPIFRTKIPGVIIVAGGYQQYPTFGKRSLFVLVFKGGEWEIIYEYLYILS